MSLSVVAGNRSRLSIVAAAVAAVTIIALALGATGAKAAELIYWDNYRDEPNTIGFANVDGSGGSLLNLSGLAFDTSEGMAYDPVTNRLFVAVESPPNEGEIVSVAVDGSGASVFNAPGATAVNPEGVAIDATTRILYWANTGNETIGYGKLDGSGGGTLNTTGATVKGMYRLALDPTGSRVYWTATNEAGEKVIGFANTDNSGGGTLPASLGKANIRGLATDPISNRLYALAAEGAKGTLFSTALPGGAFTPVPLDAAYNEGYGLAIDPVLGKAYWGNYGVEKSQVAALGFSSLAGIGGTISPLATHTNGTQDPVIIKSPVGAGAPVLTQAKAQLSCSTGSWAPDYPTAYVYQAPRTYAYQWSLNAAPIPGAVASTLTATAAGAYACTVTGGNPAGAAAQTSATAATVTAARFAISAKKKSAKARIGKSVTFKVSTLNRGDLRSVAGKICLKVPKKARKALKAQKCAVVPALGSGKSKVSKLKVKVKPAAVEGKRYKLKITAPKTKPLKVSLKVIG